MKRGYILALVLILCLALTSQAQLGGLMNKAKNSVNKKEEKKPEEKKVEEKKVEEKKPEEKKEVEKNNSNSDASPLQNNASNQTEDPLTIFKKENIADNGMTSETHKSNVGKLVFSKGHIIEKVENPSAFQANFSGTDVIYARCYFPQSLFNTPLYAMSEHKDNGATGRYIYYKKGQLYARNELCQFYVEILIDDKKIDEILTTMPPAYSNKIFIKTEVHNPLLITSSFYDGKTYKADRQKKTTLEIYINPTKDEKADNFGTVWPFIVNALSVGEHNVKLKVWPVWGDYDGGSYGPMARSNEPICVGEFKYTKAQGDFFSYGKPYSKVAPKAAKSDPTLEAKVKTLVNNYTTYSQGHKMLKCIIIEKDWNIVHHDISHKIVCRTIQTWGIIKNADGSCIQVVATVTETYDGKGYGNAYLREGFTKTGDGDSYIDCSTVK